MLLLVAFGAFRVVSPSLSAPIPPSLDSLGVTVAGGPGELAQEQRVEIQSRPLFWPSRRPLEPAAEEPLTAVNEPTAAKPLKGVTLKGVFGAGEDAGVIVLSKDRKRRLLVGDSLNGWTLDSVQPTEVRFVDGANEAVLQLNRGKLSKSAKRSDGSAAASTAPERAEPEPVPAEPLPASARHRAAPVVPAAGSSGGSGLGLGGGDRNRGGDKK
ncbi:hypothetical protein EY643_14155 [Halioglobus maricola]|uniref:Type II secretion system protein GspC N-terminal domain-containing protein n=1 Tax=Halioglobus maricola TaxID=2601894 RepID=A0A5P9NLG0_9GAMM|nr:hypothetical protein [Halioglobus maricola]QFU76703.1 hypothetical protein EY643_14155 [Halioglobus maricola]